MNNSTSPRKIPVGILGATGSVGQKFIELLANHPWFEITALAASERSSNKSYNDAANWFLPTKCPDFIAEMPVQVCKPNLNCEIVFSGLDSSVAGEIETEFANAGYIVLSNAKNHRMDDDVPLLIPEINSEHLALIKKQNFGRGKIVTNPNCSTIGLALVLKPLLDNFGIENVNVVTLQALSGAGYPGVASLDIIDNVLPFISGEEDKIETEPLKIFGQYEEGNIKYQNIKISALCNRVAVTDGHLECVSVSLSEKAAEKEIIKIWKEFTAEPQKLNLPSAPKNPLYYFQDDDYPQPRLHRNIDKGMAACIGRLRKCNIFDYKFNVLSHNTIRGAAGGAILNAELMIKKGYI
jgi:aspartate-semialdehyde dehydrogenase